MLRLKASKEKHTGEGLRMVGLKATKEKPSPATDLDGIRLGIRGDPDHP